MTQPAGKEVPKIDIILLGSPGVGKATFLSRLPHVRPPQRQRPGQPNAQPAENRGNPTTPSTSQTTLVEPSNNDERHLPSSDSQTTLVPPQIHSQTNDHPPPLTGPLNFNVSLFARPYAITIHPSTSQLFTDPFPTNPDLLILTFAIPSRPTLHNLVHYWMPQYHLHYPTSTIPILLLGLQRDLRTAKIVTRTATPYDAAGTTAGDAIEEYECVMPEEGVQAAREMRLDRYAECSALTGELMWEATQDLTKMAAQTTVDRDAGGDGRGPGGEGCVLM